VSINGFLPADVPLQRLPHASYDPWESLICDLPTVFSTVSQSDNTSSWRSI